VKEEQAITATSADCMPLEVLLVEDSPHYVRLIQETFRSVNTSIHFSVASDGVEAMAFLRHEGPAQKDAPRPDLILLDLGLPKMDGCDVLARVKADNGLKTIPILVLTTSDAQADIARSYQLHANSYLRKPLRLEELEQLLKSVNDFWLTRNQRPDKTSGMNRIQAEPQSEAGDDLREQRRS
jgi:chemotaxis family two-component system response regulator Rcp1